MTEEEELKWFSKANLSKYIGKYIAIVDNEVVAYGNSGMQWNGKAVQRKGFSWRSV